MSRNLTVTQASTVQDDPIYATTASAVAANDLLVYDENNAVKTASVSSTMTVYGPKLNPSYTFSSVGRSTYYPSTGVNHLASTCLNNGNIAYVFNDTGNSNRASVTVMSPTLTSVVAPIALHASATIITCDIHSLAGGGFVVGVWLNTNEIIVAAYQADGTVILAPTNVATLTIAAGCTVKVCRADTTGTGFAIFYCNGGSSLTGRNYTSAGVALMVATIYSSAAAASQFVSYGYGSKFTVMRNPYDGLIYLATFNNTTTTSSYTDHVYIASISSSSLANNSSVNTFSWTTPSAITAFKRIEMLPWDGTILVFVAAAKYYNNANYGGYRFKSFAAGSLTSSWSAEAGFFGDSGLSESAYAYGHVGTMKACIADHSTGRSFLALADPNGNRIRVLEFAPGAATALERNTVNHGCSPAYPNITICANGDNVYTMRPASVSAPSAASIYFDALSAAPEVVSVTATYDAYGKAVGVPTATDYAVPSGDYNIQYALKNGQGMVTEDHNQYMHRKSVSLPNGGFAYLANSITGSSEYNTYGAGNAQSYAPQIVFLHADASSAYSAVILHKHGTIYNWGQASSSPMCNLQSTLHFVNNRFCLLRKIYNVNSVYSLELTILDATGRTCTYNGDLFNLSSGSTLSHYDAVDVGGNRLFVAWTDVLSTSNATGRVVCYNITSGGSISTALALTAMTGNQSYQYGRVAVGYNKTHAIAVTCQDGSPATTPTFSTTTVPLATMASPSHGTVASPNGLGQNNAALRIVPFGSGSSKFAIFFSTSSSSSVYEYLFTTNGSNAVYSTNTNGVLYGFKVFNKPDGSAAFVYNPTTSGTAVNNYGPDKTTVSTGYATVGTNTNYGYTFRAADGTLLARIPTNTDWSYFSSAVVPSVAGVAKAAANSGDVVGIARTGTYRLNKSYGTFVFNNKGSSPPGAKGIVTGATAILNSSKTNIN